jgi:hypothetical protein
MRCFTCKQEVEPELKKVPMTAMLYVCPHCNDTIEDDDLHQDTKSILSQALSDLSMEDNIWSVIWAMSHDHPEFIAGHRDAAKYRNKAINLLEKLLETYSHH